MKIAYALYHSDVGYITFVGGSYFQASQEPTITGLSPTLKDAQKRLKLCGNRDLTLYDSSRKTILMKNVVIHEVEVSYKLKQSF